MPRNRVGLHLAEWEAELHKFENLKSGWNGYDAPPPNPAAIASASDYLCIAQQEGFQPHRIEPSVMGGIGVTHRQDNRKVYVEFYNHGAVHSLFSERSGKMHTMPVIPDDEQIRCFIVKAKEYLDGRDSP
jgi:hypothetical protein